MRRFRVINIKKHFSKLFFGAVGLLIIAQALLTVPQIRQTVSFVESRETFQTMEQLTGELTLTLDGTNPDAEIKVLQNGEPIGAFDQAQITVAVQDNSVIEIAGYHTKQPFSVHVTKQSANISKKLPQSVEVCSNIAMLGRIFIK